MNKHDLKIADLITVPPVETVIQLETADSRDLDLSRGLLTSFVLTDEIENALAQLFTHILEKKGAGAFLKGNYGSGKSHFLAVVSLLLESNQCWQFITHPLLKQFSDIQKQQTLIVKIALHNYSAGEPLEAIILEETEKALQDRTGKPILLRSKALLIEHFNRYILPQHSEFLKSADHSRESWKRFCKTDLSQAVKKVTAFIQSHGIPLKAQFDRRQSLRTLLSFLKNEQFAGIFFAVDELSEFLKSKSNSSLLSEDLRFLQFLGEACKQNPFYLVATLQENIEQTGYVEDDLVYRIKDRFPLRFSLSAHHVNQLISKRLVQKKAGSDKPIQVVYDRFRSSFPKLEVGPKTFTEIYPVHPDTVTMLEGLTPIFSQHRGVVDFIYHQLTGDENRQWDGMLSLGADCLMTPDTIFDHFRERIKEHPDLEAYSEVVFKTIEREIPALFESEKDQHIALKAVKILILVEISPLEKRPTIQKLAQMVNEPVSDLEENLNYQYLEEVILGKLIKEGSFVCRSETDAGEIVYHVSLEQTVHQMVRNRVQEFLKRPVQIQEEFLKLFPYLRTSQIPFTFFTAGQRKKCVIKWQNTNREGWVYFKPYLPVGQVDLETIVQQLKTTESDFVLIIGGISEEGMPEHPPFGLDNLEGHFTSAILGWLPRPFQEEKKLFLHRFYAYTKVLDQLGQGGGAQERQMRAIVKEWLETNETNLVTIVEDAYYGGRIADNSGWLSFRFSLLYPDFMRLLQQLFSPVLQNLFPRHGEIMPGDAIQPFAVEKLFVQFIRSGKISKEDARAQHLDTLITAYLSPLSIVETSDEEVVLSISFKENTLGTELISACIGEKPVDLFSLYWQMRKGKWGISKFQFQLLLSALLASGRLTTFQSGNVVPFRMLTQLSDGSIDAVGEGKLVSENIQQSLRPLLALSDFEGIPDHFTVSTQEQIWRRLKQFREKLTVLLAKRSSLTSRYETYPAYPRIATAIEVNLELLEQFCGAMKVSYSAREGLEKIGSEMGLDRLYQVSAEVEKLKTLNIILETHFAELNQIYTYLHHPSLPKAVSEDKPSSQESFQQLYRQVENGDFLEVGRIADFSHQFYEFKNQYVKWYSQAHDEYYSSTVFQESAAKEAEPRVQVLKRFHRLESVVATPDWITIQEEILHLPTPCRRKADRQITATPICECGFIPGQKIPESSKERIRLLAKDGIESVLHQLQTTFRWAVEEYLDGLNRVGETEMANKLSQLLTIPAVQVEKVSYKLLELSTDRVINAINSAIRGKVLILQRPVRTLIDKISGKQMTVKEIRKDFDLWLTGGEEISEDTHVHILSKQETPDFDRQQYRGADSIVHEDGIRFFEAFWLLAWALQHDKIEWLDWVKGKYRIRSDDWEIILSLREQLASENDSAQMAIYFSRTQIVSRLEQLVEIGEMTLGELQGFILNETLLESLSLTASTYIARKIAPTEPLPRESIPFLKSLRSHSCLNQWSHLVLLKHFLTTIELVSQGEAVTNRMKYYLSGGWQLTGLLEEVKQNNSLMNIISDDRVNLLTDRITVLQEQLVLGTEGVGKKELPFPYFSIKKFPKRLKESIAQSPVVLFIVDAMRWDVWEGLRSLFEKTLSNHRLDYLAAMEVASPTNTEVNRALLIQELADVTGALEWYLETVSEEPSKQKKVIENLHREQDLIVLNTTIVDTLLHERREPFLTMLDVIRTRMEALMGPVLRAISQRSTVVITSDHGFVEKDSKYAHGGDSYFEKVVPFSVWNVNSV